MLIYTIAFIWTLFFSYCCNLAWKPSNVMQKFNNNRLVLVYKEFFLILSCIPLIILSGVRYDVGTDYLIYSNSQFPEVLAGINDRVEILYRWVIKFGNHLGDIQWVFLITHFLIIYISFKGFYKLSRNYTWSIFIFIFSGFFNNSLNIMRQSIGIAIFLFALQYVVKKQPIRYYLAILVAILFHKTAIIYLPIYLLRNIKFNKKFSVILIVSSSFFSPLLRNGMIWISNTFNIYTNYFSSYTTQDFGNSNNTILFVCLFLFSLSYIFDEKIDSQSRTEWALYNNLLLITIFLTINSSILPNNYRIIYMFFICSCYLVPIFFTTKMSKLKKKLLSLILITAFLFLFFRLIVIGNMGETFPFKTFFTL